MSRLFQNRWWLIFLLFTGTLINAIDRGSISTAAPSMMKELNIDATMMGVILSSFFWAYLVLNIPAGLIADRFGPKATLGWSAFLWSVFSALTGTATRFWHVVLFRIGVGAGEAAINPVNTKVVRANFSSAERGMAVGWYLSGFRLGFAAAPVIMAYLIQAYSWRHAFIITGAASLLWVVLWMFTYQEKAVADPTAAAPAKIPWRELLRHRNITGIVLCKFFQDYSFYLFVTWMPAYLIVERKMTLIKGSWYAAIPWIAAFFFQPMAGWFSDRLIRRGQTPTQARKSVIIAMNVLAAVIIFAPYTDSAKIAVALLTLSLAFESASSVILWTVCAEIAPGPAAASVAGIMNPAGALAGIIAPVVTGYLLTTTGKFEAALLVGGIMFVLVSLTMWLVVGKVETIRLSNAPQPEPVH